MCIGYLLTVPKRILVDAIHRDKAWLVPQAESVIRQLRAQAQ
jgi:hypothetical protein